MGASNGDFVKYPRTPHLFGSKGTDDDKQMNERESLRFLDDASLIVEEKVDGTNVGIHGTTSVFDRVSHDRVDAERHFVERHPDH